MIEEEQCKSLATQVSLPPPLSRRRRAATLYTSRLEITAWLRTHPQYFAPGTGLTHTALAAAMRRAAGGLAAAEEDAPTQEELDAEQEDEGRHHILLAHWLAGCPGVMLFLTLATAIWWSLWCLVPWANNDPFAQMSAAANFALDDPRTIAWSPGMRSNNKHQTASMVSPVPARPTAGTQHVSPRHSRWSAASSARRRRPGCMTAPARRRW